MTELPDHVDHPRGMPARRPADRGPDSRCPPSSNCSKPSSPPGCARSRRRRSCPRRRCPHSPTPRRWPRNCPASGVPRRRVLRSGRRPRRREPGHRCGHGLDRVRGVGRRRAQPGQRRTLDGRVHRLIADITRIAHESDATIEVIIATAWDCPFDGPTDPQRVVDIATAAVESAPTGSRSPTPSAPPRRAGSTALIETVRPVIGDLPLGAHFHNTRGAGLASAYAAVTAGVTRLDSSVGGLGGCPFAPGASGNIATEDLVYMLRDSGIGVDVDLQAAIARRRRRTHGRRPRPAERAAARRRSHPGLSRAMPARDTHREGPPDPRCHRARSTEAVRRARVPRHDAGRHHVGGGQVARRVLPVLRRQGGPAGGAGRVVPA